MSKGKVRTVEHKSFSAPSYPLVLHCLETYLNKYPTLELVTVQETNIEQKLVRQDGQDAVEYSGTYFIVWSS